MMADAPLPPTCLIVRVNPARFGLDPKDAADRMLAGYIVAVANAGVPPASIPHIAPAHALVRIVDDASYEALLAIPYARLLGDDEPPPLPALPPGGGPIDLDDPDWGDDPYGLFSGDDDE